MKGVEAQGQVGAALEASGFDGCHDVPFKRRARRHCDAVSRDQSFRESGRKRIARAIPLRVDGLVQSNMHMRTEPSALQVARQARQRGRGSEKFERQGNYPLLGLARRFPGRIRPR